MTKSKRLKPVARFAESRERDAAVALSGSRRIRDEREARLKELESFRSEYAQRFLAEASNGIGAGQMREYRIFLDRLDQAIGQQRKQVVSAQLDYEERRRDWLALRGRAKALGKVVSRYQHQESRALERREQSASDDHSQRCNGKTSR